MNTIGIDKYELKMFSNWGEMDSDTAKRVAGILLGSEVDQLRKNAKLKEEKVDFLTAFVVNADWYHIRLKLFFAMLRVRWRFGLQWKLWHLRPEHYAQILRAEAKVVDWVFLKPLTTQLLPRVKVGMEWLYGPRDYMGGVTIGEFEMAQLRYMRWRKSRSRNDLQLFFGVLYRPLRKDIGPENVEWHRDRRAELNEITSDRSSSKLRMLDEEAMLLAVLYWEGCLKRMRQDYKYVFQGEGSKRKHGAGHLIVKLAGTVKKMDVNETAKASLHVVMEKLNSDIEEAEERMRAIRRKRK